MFKALKFLYRYVGNYGWAIILLTIAIRMLLFARAPDLILHDPAQIGLAALLDRLGLRGRDDAALAVLGQGLLDDVEILQVAEDRGRSRARQGSQQEKKE